MSVRNKQNVSDANQEVNDGVGRNTTSMPAYLQAALRISTSHPLGAPAVDTKLLGDGFPSPEVNSTVPVPGILVMNYIPTLGVSTSSASPLNRAMYNEFNAIRSQISGNRPYEPSDHMIYRLCVDGLREMYLYARRIYGIIRRYSATNLYKPKAVLWGMQLDGDDWYAHAADLYQWLANNRGALTPFPTVPIGKISSRHELYNTYLFSDGDIDSTQTYILNQRAFYSYESVDEVKGAKLVAFPTTYNGFVELWDRMYTALQNSSDVYIIAADIRRAFTDKVITDLPTTDADYTVEYVKLDPVLTSIMNANVCYVPAEQYDNFKVVDRPGEGLYCKPTASIRESTASQPINIFIHTHHVNMVSASPEPDAILQAMRLHPVLKVANTFDVAERTYGSSVEVESMGTEFMVGGSLVGMNSDGSFGVASVSSGLFVESDNYGEQGPIWDLLLGGLGALSNFDWHFPVYVVNAWGQNNDTLNYRSFRFEDIQNYVPVEDTVVSNIHNANLLAEFGL